jgi:hypothetical protein
MRCWLLERKLHLLKGLVLDALVVVEESGLDLLLRDLAELSSVAGSSGFVLDMLARFGLKRCQAKEGR